MSQFSGTRSLLLELADHCLLFMSEGRSGPYAAGVGREAYEAMLLAKARRAEKKCMRDALQRLKEQKLIRIKKQGEDFAITFTKEGYIAVLKQRIIDKRVTLPTQRICLISFDVPEDIRSIRWMIRDLLKKAGFKQAHKSVWITRRDVILEFQQLIDLLHAKPWLKVYEAQEK